MASPLPFYISPCYNLVSWAITAMKLILLRSLTSYFLIRWILQHSYLTLLTMPSLLKLTPPSSAFNSLDFFAIFSAAYMLVFIRVFALDPLALCCLGWQFVHFHGLPGTGTLMPPELYLQRLKFSFLPAPNLQLASMYLNFFIMEAFKHKKSRDGNIMNLMSHLVPIIHAWQCFSSHLHTF